MHGFEKLDIESMIRRENNNSKMLRRIARVSRRNIVKEINPKILLKSASDVGIWLKT